MIDAMNWRYHGNSSIAGVGLCFYYLGALLQGRVLSEAPLLKGMACVYTMNGLSWHPWFGNSHAINGGGSNINGQEPWFAELQVQPQIKIDLEFLLSFNSPVSMCQLYVYYHILWCSPACLSGEGGFLSRAGSAA